MKLFVNNTALLRSGFFISLIALVFFIPQITNAASVTVGPGQSIQTAVNAASAGDIINVSGGTYTGRVTVSKPLSLICSGVCVVVDGFDLAANTITLKGFEVKGARGIYVRGQGSVIENNYVHDTQSGEGGILLAGSAVNHITVRSNKIERVYNQCITMTGSNNVMENNDCGYTKQPPNNPSGDADCFDVFGGYNTFRGNTCHDLVYGQYITTAHIDCFQTWNWSTNGGALHDSQVESNVCNIPSTGSAATAKAFQVSGKTGSEEILYMSDGGYYCRNLTFRNNVIHAYLLSIFNYCQDVTITNNTFVGDASVSVSAGIHLIMLKGVNTIQHNIFVDQQKDAAFTSYDATTTPTLKGGYNFIYRSNGVPIGSPKTGDIWDVDPQFINQIAGEYHLKAGSPACGFGAFACGTSATPTPTLNATATPAQKQGDANGDGLVDETDYSVWLSHFGQTITGSVSVGDFNADGMTNGIDYAIWLNNYGK